jgi:hypothetical protein
VGNFQVDRGHPSGCPSPQSNLGNKYAVTVTATGSGVDYALGAMSAGATVTEALVIAAEHDAYTGDEHDCLSLDVPAQAKVRHMSGERYDLKAAKKMAEQNRADS